MSLIRVLIVDDSDLARDFIKAILSSDSEIAVAGEAKNGKEAVEKVRLLKPDIVTMDIEMPVMNGLEAIEQIMGSNAVPILVVTSWSDANTAYAAISKGALDLVAKPDVNLRDTKDFIRKIKLLSRIRVIRHIRGRRAAKRPALRVPSTFRAAADSRVVAIAASTGGPEALSIILSELPESFPCPLIIAQHNSDGFIQGLVEWLRRITKLRVKVAEEGEPLVAGTAYVSPSERHTEITASKKIAFIDRSPKDIYHPSCDILLTSAARAYRAGCTGIILTGMGNDGVLGIRHIREAGGMTLAQDEKTCIVYSMPKVAIENGYIDRVLPVDELGREIMTIVAAGREAKTGDRDSGYGSGAI